MVVYVDIVFFNNTLMTLAIIWAVGHLLNLKTRWWKLILAAIIGTIYTFIVLYFQFTIDFYVVKVLFHIILNILTAFIMVYTAFGKLSIKKFLKAVGYLYLTSFITIGSTLSLFYIYGITPFEADKNRLFLIFGLLILIIIGKFGWRLFQKYVTPDIFYVQTNIIIRGREIELIGLVDTGNQLNDPLTHVPVIIVELEKILSVFSINLRESIMNNKGGIMGLSKILNENGWGNRIRVLPFSNLGQEHGLLLGLRPDMVEITYKNKLIQTERVVIGLSDHKLDEEDEYQVLIHPQLLH